MDDDNMPKKMKFKIVSDEEKRTFTTLETILLVILSLVIGLLIGGLFSKTNIVTKKIKFSQNNFFSYINK